MLRKRLRLNIRKGVRFSHSFSTTFFLLRISKNNLNHNRYGFIISKKVDKRAVARNKIKRLLAKCLMNIEENIITGYDMLFTVKKEAVQISEEDICRDVGLVLGREGFLK